MTTLAVQTELDSSTMRFASHGHQKHHTEPTSIFCEKERVYQKNCNENNEKTPLLPLNESVLLQFNGDEDISCIQDGTTLTQKSQANNEDGVAKSLPINCTFRPFGQHDTVHTLEYKCALCGGGRSSRLSLPYFAGYHHEYQSLDVINEESHPCLDMNGFVDSIIGVELGADLTLLEQNFVSKEELFSDKQHEFHWRLMVVRGVSYAILSLAFLCILNPVAQTLAQLPVFGYLLLNATWFASILVGIAMGVIVTATAWVLYRPQFLAGGINIIY